MRRLSGILAGVLLAAGSLVAVGVAPAGALTTITVLNNNDAGAGSLRQAFVDANAGGVAQADDVVIVIPASVGTISLTTGSLSYNGGSGGTHALTVEGSGNTIDQTVAGPQVVSCSNNGTLTINGLTITGADVGGGGGGINAFCNLVVTNSTVSGNTAGGGSGGIGAFGSLVVTNSTVSGNTAGGGGGGINVFGSLVVTNSTVSGNTAGGGGGGILAFDGLVVTNSTVSGNTATSSGGGIGVCGVGSNVLVYATVVENTAPFGANLAADACNSSVGAAAIGDPLMSFGSVVALPQGGGDNCAVLVDDPVGFNFSDDDSCEFSASTDKQNAGDPLLGALADNGGPTLTRLPQTGSPLIDAIPNANCADGNTLAGFAVTTDQRALARPEQTGGNCDIGAVEVQLSAAAPIEITIRFTG